MNENRTEQGTLSQHYNRLAEAVPSDIPFLERVDRVCETLEGYAYKEHPLGGGPTKKENFSISLRWFDCVTFIETVTAFCVTRNEIDFRDFLRRLRYSRGRVDYFARHHYMTSWIAENSRESRIFPLHGPMELQKQWEKILTVIPALEAVPAVIRGWPKNRLARVRQIVRSGDLIFFISVRRHLDYFHTGVLLNRQGYILLASARQSKGKVVMEPLDSFLRSNRMSGVTIVRPNSR